MPQVLRKTSACPEPEEHGQKPAAAVFAAVSLSCAVYFGAPWFIGGSSGSIVRKQVVMLLFMRPAN